MNFYALPQSLYDENCIKNILSHKNNCILYKEIDSDSSLSGYMFFFEHELALKFLGNKINRTDF